MKKLYASIFASLFCLGTMMAQDDTTFAFTYNGEVIPNGSTVVASTVTDINLGGLHIFEIHLPLQVKNVSEDASPLKLICIGKNNSSMVSFCPNGNCVMAADGQTIDTTYPLVAAGATAEQSEMWLHAGTQPTPATSFTYDGTIELHAQAGIDDEDCAHVTIHFDTNGQDGVLGLTSVAEEQAVEVFNLCGRKVANTTEDLPKGIYIIRQGQKSRKVTVK